MLNLEGKKYAFAESFMSANYIHKDWACKSQIRKVSQLRNVRKLQVI
jgi:hypothetical protein